MNDRIAVVTGADGGIGQATVVRFEIAGWTVVGLDREQGDLSDPRVSAALFEGIAVRYGRVHALVNNAAVQLIRPLGETSPEDWDRTLAVNLRAAFLAVRNAHRLLAAAGAAAIVNISSVHALATSRGLGAYAASKGGLLALTRSLAVEFASEGIRVNAVLPGAIDTPMLRQGLERFDPQVDRAMDALARRTPLGRIGRPEEVASAILFLADAEQSAFITGQALVVDGGAMARLSTE